MSIAIKENAEAPATVILATAKRSMNTPTPFSSESVLPGPYLIKINL